MENTFRKYKYELSELSEEDWAYISEYRAKFIVNSEYLLDQGLRFPGFIIDGENKAIIKYKSFAEKRFNTKKPVVSPRGNLGSNYHYRNAWPTVVCGIAPGISVLSRNESKWLLGPSSKILHKILYSLGIFPYFTNIYKRAFAGNNTGAAKQEYLDKSLAFLKKELDLVKDVYSDYSGIFLLTLGSYKEYTPLEDILDKKFHRISTYHPSYYLRNGVTSIKHEMIIKGMNNIQNQMDTLLRLSKNTAN